MAKAIATCICKYCGKEFEATATKRNTREAESWAAWASKNYCCCPECDRKLRDQYNAECAAEARKRGWVRLEGSPKQTGWAESIRMEKMDGIEADVQGLLATEREHREKGENTEREHANNVLIRITQKYAVAHIQSAGWWIDNRTMDGPTLLRQVLRENRDAIMQIYQSNAAEYELK